MSDYSHLGKLDITDETLREYVFEDIVIGTKEDGSYISPSIFCAAMVDSNRAYHNEQYRIATERAEQLKNESRAERRKRVMSVDADEENRVYEKQLIANACARRWGVAMPDVKGEVHDLTPAECLSFLKALPLQIYQPFVRWLENPYNFFERTALIAENVEALGNSSPSG